MITGCVLAALTYYPIFHGLTHYANPALEQAIREHPVVLFYNGSTAPESEIDAAREMLTKRGYPFTTQHAAAGTAVTMQVGVMDAGSFDEERWVNTLHSVGYPSSADPERINSFMVVMLLVLLMVYVAMVYGPIAAFLVELFPTRIRYTSMSLPYHLGNGWFGGFLPLIAASITVVTGNIYSGLYYPIVIALMTALVGGFFVPETKDRIMHDEDQ